MSDEIQIPPPPHVKFTKQGRAYRDIYELIDSELARFERNQEHVEKPSTNKVERSEQKA